MKTSDSIRIKNRLIFFRDVGFPVSITCGGTVRAEAYNN